MAAGRTASAGGGSARGDGGPVSGTTATGVGVAAACVATGVGDELGAPVSRLSAGTKPQPAITRAAAPISR